MQLNYKQFGNGFPVIILHGLFGCLDNWQTIAKKLASQFSVYIIDQRNHGRSPHTHDFNYQLMSHDLFEFFQQQKIGKAHLIGHSMGGKTAMQFALAHADKVAKLIVVDVAPVKYEDRHSEVFNALFAVPLLQITARNQAEKILRTHLKEDEATIQFLMKALTRTENTTGFEWKFNLQALHTHYTAISGAISSPNVFTGKTLFIKGEKSSYINPENFHIINALFPNNELTEISNAGHWVHAENQKDFLLELERFLA